ncbi:MAG: hypothetical protein GXP02_05365, partial [Alphaproteobacteria bacterium]|nr:hypothetical protein [Alphaproteobacteria bacterium]
TSISSGFSVPAPIEKTLIRYLLEQRTANIITVPASGIKNIPSPDEKTLKKYYQDNYARYMAPEYRNLRFITLSSKDFIKDVTVTAKEIDQAMASSAKTPNTGEKRQFEQILFKSKKNAFKAYTDLKAGRHFADIITVSGSTVEDAAASSTSQKDAAESYGPQAAKIIYTTKATKYTAPVKTDFGWRIFKITKITASAAPAENTRAKVVERLKKAKAVDLLYSKSEKVNDELAAGSSLSDIAKKLSLKLKVATGVSAAGYNAKGDRVTNIPKDPSFLLKAFALSPGDDPVLEEMDDNNYYLLVVDHVPKTALRPYKDVQTAVLALWRANTRRDMARKNAAEILKEVRKGTPLKKISTATAGTSYTSVTLARNDRTAKVTKSIKTSIFSLETGQAKVIPAADGNGFIVVKLLSRKISNGSMPAAQSSKINQLLKQEYQQRFLSRYWEYLETSLPVKINQAAVKAANDQLASRGQ